MKFRLSIIFVAFLLLAVSSLTSRTPAFASAPDASSSGQTLYYYAPTNCGCPYYGYDPKDKESEESARKNCEETKEKECGICVKKTASGRGAMPAC